MNGGSPGLTILAFYYLLANLLLFGLMGWDKLSAIKGWWRVPEKRLLILGLLSGGLGGLAGMLLFHHKVNKPKFWAVFLLGFLGHVGGWFLICQHFF
jgi:uncharacterized membrane protein YsdA (DUF1294 family)